MIEKSNIPPVAFYYQILRICFRISLPVTCGDSSFERNDACPFYYKLACLFPADFAAYVLYIIKWSVINIKKHVGMF